jgi:purine-binding chemotaxis protein CheW
VETTRQYLLFTVAGLQLAVALETVSEIVPYESVSAVPGTPPHVRGVVPVRGRILPVIDLAVKLGRTPEPPGKRTCILIVELQLPDGTLSVGIVMDGVATLMDAAERDIAATPRFGGAVKVQHVQGLLPTAQGMVPLIDVVRVFADDELSSLTHVTEAAAVGLP